jgi:hypothetical protein
MLLRRRLVWGVVVFTVALLPACGRVVEVPGRDTDTPPYYSVIQRIPSFWLDGVDGPVVIPILLRDDRAPDGVPRETLREILTAAVATWREPLEEEERNVRLSVIFASEGYAQPARGVQVTYIDRPLEFIGVTHYNGEQVEVEIAVRPAATNRFLTRRELLALTIHEMGHALGISRTGHSPNPNDVMFGHDLTNDWITLSEGDRKVILALFPD